ncbi:MAG: hypothetical protein K8T10_06510 [Candidatus Eremiobacteraeota bacterium]|nr:hypothetical protein [Candidatus Eremiobacteraeota bacterium]
MNKETLKKHILVLMIFFLMGLSSTICQSILFREFLVIFYGNELILGVILFFWLIAITAGAIVYPLIADRIRDYNRLFLNLTFIFSILPIALIPFIRMSRALSGTPYGQFMPFLSMVWISLIAIFPPGFLIGLTFPVGCRILGDKTAVARIYISESLGSLTGGVVFSFLLIRFLSTPFIASLILILFSGVIFAYHILARSHAGKIKRAAIFLVLFFTLISPFAASYIDRTTLLARWRTLIKDMPLLDSRDSPYQNLALTKQEDQYNVFFNGIYGFSFPVEYDDATAAHHILTQHPSPKNILIIGEVTPGFIKETLKQPVESVTMVYLDPSLYEMMEPVLSKKEKKILQNPRVKHAVSDGRLFVKNTKNKYDLIFLNMPDPSTAFINRYYTLEFFQEILRIMKPGAVVALNITSSENFLGKGSQIADYNTTIYRTVNKVFPYISMSPGTHTHFFASFDKSASSDDYNVLFKRFQERNISDTVFTPYIFETIYEPERVKFKKQIYRENIKGRINTDLSPVAYLHNLKLWDKYSSSRLAGVISFMEKKGTVFWISILIAIVVLYLLSSLIIRPGKARSAKFCSLFSVFATGLCAMGFTVLLSYSYQSLYGYLFEKIGFLIALFMLGLFLGGSSVHRIIKKKIKDLKEEVDNIPQSGGDSVMPLFMGVLILIVILGLSLPFILGFLGKLPSSYQFLFFLIVMIVGVLSGHIFPLAAYLMEEWGSEVGRAAAFTDSADHFGGCIGAILIGAFFVPLLGIAGCSFFLAALEGTAVILWIIYFILVKTGILRRA